MKIRMVNLLTKHFGDVLNLFHLSRTAHASFIGAEKQNNSKLKKCFLVRDNGFVSILGILIDPRTGEHITHIFNSDSTTIKTWAQENIEDLND